MRQVWLPDHGWGRILKVDEKDKDLPFLVEWEDGTAGWHGLEVTYPRRRVVWMDDKGRYWADTIPLAPGYAALLQPDDKTYRVVREPDGWYLVRDKKKIRLQSGMTIWC